MYKETFGQRLKQARKETGYTLKEIQEFLKNAIHKKVIKGRPGTRQSVKPIGTETAAPRV